MRKQRVCILGGSGFVGRNLCSQLATAGYAIDIITRRKSQAHTLSVLPDTRILELDVNDPQALNQAFESADVVINLIGILNESGHDGDGFRRAHVDIARKVLTACQQNNVPRLLHMSALNADAAYGPSHYLRTKGEAENMVLAFAEKTRVTCFKPSIIFGDGDSFFNRFAGLLRLTPWVFPLACGNARFAPIHVEEVAAFFIDSIDDKSTYGKAIELCGPEIYTLKQLLQFTSQKIGRRHYILNLPDSLAKLQASILEYMPGKPFSLDNYRSLQVDSVCQGEHVFTGKHSIHSVVPGYLKPR